MGSGVGGGGGGGRAAGGQQPCALVRLTAAAAVGTAAVALGLGWWGCRRGHVVSQGKAAVVEALGQQDHVGDGVVDGENDHGGQHALQHGAQNVEDIAEQPDDDKLDGEAFGAAAAEVLDDLGREDDDPAGDGYGAGVQLSARLAPLMRMGVNTGDTVHTHRCPRWPRHRDSRVRWGAPWSALVSADLGRDQDGNGVLARVADSPPSSGVSSGEEKKKWKKSVDTEGSFPN